MKTFIDILNESKKEKITRNAFIYFERNEKDFAQCATCIMFVKGKCEILGPNVKVTPESSCGMYIPQMDNNDKLLGETKARMTPNEAGFVREKVRCEHCIHFDGKNSTCGLFRTLNQKMKDVFDLDEKVKKTGCCNAWQGG